MEVDITEVDITEVDITEVDITEANSIRRSGLDHGFHRPQTLIRSTAPIPI